MYSAAEPQTKRRGRDGRNGNESAGPPPLNRCVCSTSIRRGEITAALTNRVVVNHLISCQRGVVVLQECTNTNEPTPHETDTATRSLPAGTNAIPSIHQFQITKYGATDSTVAQFAIGAIDCHQDITLPATFAA